MSIVILNGGDDNGAFLLELLGLNMTTRVFPARTMELPTFTAIIRGMLGDSYVALCQP